MKISKAHETFEDKVDSLEVLVSVNIALQMVILAFTFVTFFQLIR